MQILNNFDIKEFINNMMTKLEDFIRPFINPLLHFIINIIILIIVFIAISFLIDYLLKDKYNIKLNRRTPTNTIGGGEEYYKNFWVWQPYKKKRIIFALQNNLKHSDLYERKSRKRRIYGKSKVPFRREIYGNVR